MKRKEENKPKLIIFDFDDTLLDNTLIDIESFNFLSKKYGLLKIKDKKIISWRKNGMLAKNIIKNMIKNKKNVLLNDCIKERLEYLRNDGGVELSREKENAKKVLQELKKQGNYNIIVSNRENKKFIIKILKKLHISLYINAVYCKTYNEKKKIKIDNIKLKEELYRKVISDLESKHNISNVIVVGNLKSDIIAAKKLKIRTIGIKGSFRYDSGLSKITHTIENLEDLLSSL